MTSEKHSQCIRNAFAIHTQFRRNRRYSDCIHPFISFIHPPHKSTRKTARLRCEYSDHGVIINLFDYETQLQIKAYIHGK